MKRALFKHLSKQSFASWTHLKKLPADPIFGIMSEFSADTDPNKISLVAGTYRDDNGKPYILKSIRKAQQIIIDKKLDMEYLGIDGDRGFVDNSVKVAYTGEFSALKEGRVSAIQTLSGTGSLYLVFKFLADHYKGARTLYIPDPTWPNHYGVSEDAGLQWKHYPYYDIKNQRINMEALLDCLDKAENESAVLLHTCAHNPTGLDPTKVEWNQILEVVKRKRHFPIFDNAYQGFASGDLDQDAYSLRKFANAGVNLALCQSYAKNFGLYGQRVGCLSIICDSKDEANVALGHLKQYARRMYSNPPKHGALLANTVWSDKELTQEWYEDLVLMSSRIQDMRTSLYQELKNAGSKLNWDHIMKQIGMFAYTGLSKDQVLECKKQHLYLTMDGRISVSGLNTKNVKKVAEIFHNVTKH